MENESQRGTGLSFQLDPEGRALIATFTPDPLSAPIDEAWLHARIEAMGCGNWRYLPQAGTLLLGRYNLGAPLAAMRVAECIDGTMDLVLSTDSMIATLSLTPPQGGIPVSKEILQAALDEKGVREGVIAEAIEQALAEGHTSNLVIARGRAPVAGDNGYFESLIPDVRDRTPRVDASGHIDYRDQGEILVVHPGDPLLRRRPPTDGVAGANLLGAPIAAKPGKDVTFAPNLSGVSIAPDDPDLLRAAIAGQPVRIKGGAMVEPVFSIEEVSVASGNIDFDGSIVIRGDVSAGMTVRVSGDIEVGGVVEAATLEAGGNIVIKGGAMGRQGHKDGGHAYHIRCGGSFTTAYVQQVSIEAGDSIFIDDMAMQSELSATNHIRVGNKKRGHIVGGKTQATLSITARVIGSPSPVITRFEVGVNPAMHKQLLEMTHQRDALETQFLEISKLLDFARHNPARVRPEMIDKAKQTASNLSSQIAALRAEEETWTKQIELASQACVIAEEEMFEGVEVFIANQRYRVVGQHGPGKIGMGKYGPGLLPLDSTTQTPHAAGH